MAMIHRTLFTWFLLLVFLILAGLRLDNRTNWNWFLVLLPMWLYDLLLLMHIGLHGTSDWRQLTGAGDHTRAKLRIIAYRLYQALLTLLKVAFLVMLCVNINSPDKEPPLSWYLVFAPLLTTMTCLCASTLAILVRPVRYRE